METDKPTSKFADAIRYGHLRYAWIIAVLSVGYIAYIAPIQFDKIVLSTAKCTVGAILGVALWFMISRYVWYSGDEKDQQWLIGCVAMAIAGMLCISLASP